MATPGTRGSTGQTYSRPHCGRIPGVAPGPARYCMAAMGCLGGYFPNDMKCLAIPLVKLSM